MVKKKVFFTAGPLKLTAIFNWRVAKQVLSTFSQIFDLFISWAVAANGGVREEAVGVWSGDTDTQVSFITVGHSLWALMEIIMQVHNCPKAEGARWCCTVQRGYFSATILTWKMC